MRSPEALQAIRKVLNKTSKKEELNRLFQTLSGALWPGDTREAANHLAQWAEKIELYPGLLKALAGGQANGAAISGRLAELEEKAATLDARLIRSHDAVSDTGADAARAGAAGTRTP